MLYHVGENFNKQCYGANSFSPKFLVYSLLDSSFLADISFKKH